jgi:hypothetical protein
MRLVAFAIARPKRAQEQKQSCRAQAAHAWIWAGGVVHRSARWRLLRLAEQECPVVRGSLLVLVLGDTTSYALAIPGEASALTWFFRV